MSDFQHELSLLLTLLLNGAVVLAAWRFVARHAVEERQDIPNLARRMADTCLVVCLVQYLSVMVAGAAGLLTPAMLGVLAGVMCALLWWCSRWRSMPKALPRGKVEEGLSQACLRPPISAFVIAFVIAFAGAMIYEQRLLPPMHNDPLTYHLPSAVSWLQQGRLDLLPTWFFNPANTYSPLAGSTLIAWLIAPVGNDVFARFVQVGPWLWLLALAMAAGRAAGAGAGVALVVAAAMALSRPFSAQVLIAKDDLLLCACFLHALMAATAWAGEKGAGWRLGAAIGLLLATKYPALLLLPALILVIDGPWRARWRPIQWAQAIITALALAGPWYARNWILTGNPLFPTALRAGGIELFPGLLTVGPGPTLRTIHGVWSVMTRGYYALPILLCVPILVGWLAWSLRAILAAGRDPFSRALALGPVLVVGAFVACSPYAEVRFVYPAILLAFVATAGILGRAPRCAGLAIAVALLIVAVATSMSQHGLLMRFIAVAAICAAFISVLVYLWRHYRRVAATTIVMASLSLAACAYVWWGRYVEEYRASAEDAWALRYPGLADAWRYVRQEIPPGGSIAYANTSFVYPMQGFGHGRRVFYVPTSPNVEALHDLSPIDKRLDETNLVREVILATRANADPSAWLNRLTASGATHLLVAKTHPDLTLADGPPPEITFATSHRDRLRPVFENEAVVIYAVIAR